MITKCVKGGLATVRMSKEEAGVLERALIIAKLHIGDDVVLGRDGRSMGIKVEHLCGVLKGIANH